MTPSKSRLLIAILLLVVLGGLGFGTNWGPTLLAGDNPPAAKPADPPRQPAKEDQIDDATFLRRISLDLRGKLPTLLETKYFLADKDAKKRRKVVEWMLEKVDPDKVIDRVRYYYRLKDKADKPEKAKPEDTKREELFWELMLKTGDKPREDVIIELLWSEQKDDLRLYWDGLQQKEKAKPDHDVLKYWSLQRDKLNLNDVLDDDLRKKISDPESRRVIEGWLLQDDPEKPEENRKQMDATLARVFQFLRRQGQQPDERLTREWVRVLLAMGQEDRTVDDATFLRRLVLDLTGALPTPLEQKYFQADSDPKKRQKVIDWLLQDPEHSKRMTVLWKEVMDAASARSTRKVERLTDPLAGLLDHLLADNRNNDQILDALTLAALARYPTETEKSFALAAVAKSQNRKLDWLAVLKALTSTNEFRHHAEAMHQRVAK